MAARETLVILRLPWMEEVQRYPSKKRARVQAEELVEVWHAFDLEVVEDHDGDLVVQEVTP